MPKTLGIDHPTVALKFKSYGMLELSFLVPEELEAVKPQPIGVHAAHAMAQVIEAALPQLLATAAIKMRREEAKVVFDHPLESGGCHA